MAGWFTWRTVIGSLLLGTVLALALFALTDRQLSLSGSDLFFAIATVISLGFNLWQLFRDKYKYAPLKDSLIGLFNDIKGRQQRAYGRQLLITSQRGMELPLEAVRLEFYDFVQETSQGFEQLREHVVAAIHTLDPESTNQQVFRAAEFGLNEQERRGRYENMERFLERARIEDQGAPRAQAAAAPPPDSPSS